MCDDPPARRGGGDCRWATGECLRQGGSTMLGGRTPDLTPAQLVAIASAIIGVIVAAGLPLSKDLTDHIVTLITVLAPVVLAADAHIRNGRAQGAGAAGLDPKTGQKPT